MVRTAYHGFNFISGYNTANPTGKSVVYRLIFLESVAGVPGMVGAGVRHFKSLRTLNRDHGWIHTLLEEAENERMHLLTVMTMFNAGIFTRIAVVGAQAVLVPLLTLTAVINPKYVHRFVGYLEETAVHTYSTIIEKVETPGTRLNEEWGHLRAPEIAINYWRMSPDSMWIDVVKQIMADEANHRDVNHTFASVNSNERNPFIEKHHKAAKDVTHFMKNKESWMFGQDILRSNSSYLADSLEPINVDEKMSEAVAQLDANTWDDIFKKSCETEKESANALQILFTMKEYNVKFPVSEKFFKEFASRVDLNKDGVIDRAEWNSFFEHIKEKYAPANGKEKNMEKGDGLVA